MNNYLAMKKSDLKKQHLIQLTFSLIILLLAAFISTRIFFRIDLTSEKRFTISEETKTILKKLDDIVYIKVYLEGDLPLGFKKFRNSIRETLDEFRIYGKENIQYQFINPSESNDDKTRKKEYDDLYSKGLKPINIQAKDKEGGASEKTVFPSAVISYKGMDIPVSLLKNNVALSAEENLNNSMQNVEYELIKSIYNISNKKVEKIAFLEGHGELSEMEVGDVSRDLSNTYQVDRGEIKGNIHVLDQYKAVIIAKPTKPFSEQDKFVLDQYLMNGGKLLWFVNEVIINPDSLANGSTFGFINNLQIDDQLFTYGVRVNSNLVQDIQCNVLPVNAGTNTNQPKWIPAPWLYYPLISPLVDHPISRNLEMVWARYASGIDSVGDNKKIKKTCILRTSRYSKTVSAPMYIKLQEIKQTPKQVEFNKPNIPIAMLLEGQFPSVFRNRLVNNIMPGIEVNYMAESIPTKMIIVGDGNMIANDVRLTAKGPMVSPLGYDKFTRQTFGNKDFVTNAINYLTDETGLMNLRSKEFKLRILDKPRIREERVKWQVINTVIPVLLIVIFGFYYNYSRKNKFAASKTDLK